MKKTICYFAALATSCYSLSSQALEYEVTLGAQSEYSDNILLSGTNEQSDLETRARVDLSLTENSKSVKANVNYGFEYFDYRDDLIQDTSVVEGTARIDWIILPEAFAWNFISSTQNLRRDLRETNIQDNRERRNIFSTGPTVSLRASAVDTIDFSAAFTDTQFQDTEINNNTRTSGNISWKHRLPRSREVAADISYAKTDFDDVTVPDIENNRAYLSYSSTFTNTQWEIKAGYNISKQDLSDDVDGPLLQAILNYRSGNQELALVALNMVTDSTIGLGGISSIIDGDIPDRDSNFGEIDIVERSYMDVRYTNHAICSVCTLTGFITYDDQDFNTLDNDQRFLILGLGFTYRFKQNFNAELTLSRDAIEFDDTDRKDDVDNILLRFNYVISPDFSTYLSFRSEQRSSNLVSAEYDELRSGLGLTYTF